MAPEILTESKIAELAVLIEKMPRGTSAEKIEDVFRVSNPPDWILRAVARSKSFYRTDDVRTHLFYVAREAISLAPFSAKKNALERAYWNAFDYLNEEMVQTQVMKNFCLPALPEGVQRSVIRDALEALFECDDCRTCTIEKRPEGWYLILPSGSEEFIGKYGFLEIENSLGVDVFAAITAIGRMAASEEVYLFGHPRLGNGN